MLIRRGLPFLSLVFQSAHWRIYAVGSPTPLAAGPGRLASLGSSRFALRASAPGRFVVRVRYSRYWAVERGSACVRRAPGGWTAVRARASGTIVVGARFSLARALGIGAAAAEPRRGGGLVRERPARASIRREAVEAGVAGQVEVFGRR